MVADKDARRLFDAICSGDFWPERYEEDTERARLVRRRLTNAFDPDRIRYYVTSAIGFVEKDLSASFDGDKFQPNYRDGESKILGDVRPINVLEPLIRMQQRIIRRRRR
jgi:hypothetical protein